MRDIRLEMAQPKAPYSTPHPPDESGLAPRGGLLRLRVGTVAESVLRSGHPWLFAESIREQNRPGRLGELAVVYDRKDRFLALGLFDPTSTIRLRVLHCGKKAQVDTEFWNQKLSGALRKREGLFDSQTTGFRWINGESDGWPGLVLDRYDRTLVLKLYTAAWVPWLDQVLGVLHRGLHPDGIVLRLSRNTQEAAADSFGQSDGQILHGPTIERPVQFLETGLLFESDVLRGQKTGFFLDQRENRRRVENLAAGRVVLNAFSFSGGFSVYAARGGARAVTNLDISSHALAAAEANLALNKSQPWIRACHHEQIRADAFEWLENVSSAKFDLVILDPPSLARRETERSGAIAAYTRLASLGLSHLNPGGILVACSCSAHVSEEQFLHAIRAGAAKSGARLSESAQTGQPPDHPAAIAEAKYLKALYLKRL